MCLGCFSIELHMRKVIKMIRNVRLMQTNEWNEKKNNDTSEHNLKYKTNEIDDVDIELECILFCVTSERNGFCSKYFLILIKST